MSDLFAPFLAMLVLSAAEPAPKPPMPVPDAATLELVALHLGTRPGLPVRLHLPLEPASQARPQPARP
ncbi:MAG TPA: hypothetical protein VIS77_05590 [Burkholderiales bacterium]